MEEKDFLVKIESLQKDLISQESDALSNLRRLTRAYDLNEIYINWGRSDIKFVAYFLKRFSDDFWKNLAVDTSIELPPEKIKETCRVIGEFLKVLIVSIKNKSIDKNYKALADVIGYYYSLIQWSATKLMIGEE